MCPQVNPDHHASPQKKLISVSPLAWTTIHHHKRSWYPFFSFWVSIYIDLFLCIHMFLCVWQLCLAAAAQVPKKNTLYRSSTAPFWECLSIYGLWRERERKRRERQKFMGCSLLLLQECGFRKILGDIGEKGYGVLLAFQKCEGNIFWPGSWGLMFPFPLLTC